MAKNRITAKRSRPAAPPTLPPTLPPAIPPLVPSLDATAGDFPVHRSHLPAGMIMVGVGASAGGLEAFTELLQSAPSDAGLTFVFVQHLSPHHTSALPALLATHTPMPVVEALNGVRVEPNHVYVIPPNVQMVLTGETLQLTPRVEDRRAPTQIDGFFVSMA